MLKRGIEVYCMGSGCCDRLPFACVRVTCTSQFDAGKEPDDAGNLNANSVAIEIGELSFELKTHRPCL